MPKEPYADPRSALSRARLLDAATNLLREGGPSAVTVGAVTCAARVARATLYRHFSSGHELLAAAFVSLIPPAPMPAEEGSLSDRLTGLVQAWAQSMAEAPATLVAMSWLASASEIEGSHTGSGADESPELHKLRERIAQQYFAPFDAILQSPQSRAELRDVDRGQAVALLLGPIILGKLSTLADFDYRACARAAAHGFVAAHAKTR